MVLKKCPRCKQIYAIMEHSGDFVHQCNSGNAALDNEDILRLNTPQWNYQGVDTTLNIRAKLARNDVGENLTKRGLRKSTHLTRAHEEYIGGN